MNSKQRKAMWAKLANKNFNPHKTHPSTLVSKHLPSDYGKMGMFEKFDKAHAERMLHVKNADRYYMAKTLSPIEIKRQLSLDAEYNKKHPKQGYHIHGEIEGSPNVNYLRLMKSMGIL